MKMWLNQKVYHKRRPKKKQKKPKNNAQRKAQLKRIEKTAQRLRANPPRSEVWFISLYKEYTHKDDLFNHVFNCYIPDVLNLRHRYIIEVDGSYHDRPDQKKKDAKKDLYFLRLGYQVIRVMAYDPLSFRSALRTVLELRNAGPVLDDNTAAGAPPENEVASTP